MDPRLPRQPAGILYVRRVGGDEAPSLLAGAVARQKTGVITTGRASNYAGASSRTNDSSATGQCR